MNNALTLIDRNKATLATIEEMRNELRREADKARLERQTADIVYLAEFLREHAERCNQTEARLATLSREFARITREIEAAMCLIPDCAFAEAKE